MRARRHHLVDLAVAVAVVGATVWIVRGGLSPSSVAPSSAPPTTPATPSPTASVHVTSASIIDGDTLTVLWDGHEVTLRLENIDAPELAHDGAPAQCLAAEAKTALQVLAPKGTPLSIVDSGLDRYGRTLAGVYLPDGRLANAELVRVGLAAPFVVGSDVRLLPPVRAAQDVAAAAGTGLFAPTGCTIPGRVASAGNDLDALEKQAANKASLSLLAPKVAAMNVTLTTLASELSGGSRNALVDGLPSATRDTLTRQVREFTTRLAIVRESLTGPR